MQPSHQLTFTHTRFLYLHTQLATALAQKPIASGEPPAIHGCARSHQRRRVQTRLRTRAVPSRSGIHRRRSAAGPVCMPQQRADAHLVDQVLKGLLGRVLHLLRLACGSALLTRARGRARLQCQRNAEACSHANSHPRDTRTRSRATHRAVVTSQPAYRKPILPCWSSPVSSNIACAQQISSRGRGAEIIAPATLTHRTPRSLLARATLAHLRVAKLAVAITCARYHRVRRNLQSQPRAHEL